jgi:hypothetical protein
MGRSGAEKAARTILRFLLAAKIFAIFPEPALLTLDRVVFLASFSPHGETEQFYFLDSVDKERFFRYIDLN